MNINPNSLPVFFHVTKGGSFSDPRSSAANFSLLILQHLQRGISTWCAHNAAARMRC
jgi:hypothetical protein